jgi:hypothetical protein
MPALTLPKSPLFWIIGASSLGLIGFYSYDRQKCKGIDAELGRECKEYGKQASRFNSQWTLLCVGDNRESMKRQVKAFKDYINPWLTLAGIDLRFLLVDKSEVGRKQAEKGVDEDLSVDSIVKILQSGDWMGFKRLEEPLITVDSAILSQLQKSMPGKRLLFFSQEHDAGFVKGIVSFFSRRLLLERCAQLTRSILNEEK